MSATINTITDPSRALDLTFRAIRLPLTAVETVTKRSGTDWPPATAFMRIEGTVLQAAGSVLRNDELALEGRRLQAAATKAERAVELDAEAALLEEQAEQEREERLARAERFQEQASERADAAREKAAQAAQDKRRKAAASTRATKTAARNREQATEAALRKRERADRLAAAKKDTEALELKGAALDKQAEVLELDEKIKRSRRTRKADVT